ncbi:SDR family NAD(P)-dependent oxidoreductase [Microbacterium sp.]|uniref:SDR family NAD(P)-dependent oxidoreductase n=1 Tax=Microbacterium sp. TaxID=51671 RepID=UPI003A8A0C06
MDLGLQGKVALVVGGTGLVGTAIVAALRAEGATVIAAARGDDADLFMDARDASSVDSGIEDVVRDHGHLDVAVISAAPSARTLDAAHNADPDAVLQAIDEKAMVFLRVANAVLPLMRERGAGRVIGVSGQNAFMTGNVRGSVRNAALILTAKNLADAYAGTGVTVNVVSPGTVSAEPRDEVGPGRGGESSPEQIADVVAFLASPRAAAVSGESIAVGHRLRGVTSM